MTEVNKEYMSKAEIIKCLQNTGLYLGPSLEGSRVGTIVDGKKFYNKMLLFDPDRFTQCKNDSDVTWEANKGPAVNGLLNVADEWGIESEKHK
ncbi:hypothetical protein FXE15_11005 [Lactobacillus sp. CAB1-7]|nr:hypothetical protein FXE15_11005 [Lactobacillus sp. CAB1-7]